MPQKDCFERRWTPHEKQIRLIHHAVHIWLLPERRRDRLELYDPQFAQRSRMWASLMIFGPRTRAALVQGKAKDCREPNTSTSKPCPHSASTRAVCRTRKAAAVLPAPPGG